MATTPLKTLPQAKVVDYNALAKQFGGTSTPPVQKTTGPVDYNKLASDFGGTSIEKKTPFVEKVGDFVGVTPLAKGLSAMAFKYLTPEGRDLEKKVNNNTATPEELQAYSEIYGTLPDAKQVAAGAAKTALTLGTLGTGSVAKTLAGRVVEGGILGGAFTALDNLQNKKKATENLATGVAIGGAIPLVGAAVKKGVQGVGKVFGGTGERIEYSLIKPTKTDLSDGFNVSNIKKYDLGGNLTQTLQKTDEKLSELTQQLKTKLASRPEAVIDLNDVANKTASDILGNKARYFGDTAGVKRVLENLANEIENVSANGLVDLPEAQIVKQSAGQKGAWVFGFTDPDAKATEMVYTKFYQQLKKEIEKKAPEGIKAINKQISELIPISHAVIRRIPVTERNNVLSLSDIISGGISFGNPKAIGLFIANRLTKSGQFAKLLTDLGENLEKNTLGKSNLGGRIFGK
jgi:hypothetical protein